jgi:hypothetical protein
MISLKEKLHTLIKERGYLSYEDFVGVCLREGYRTSTGERRMRDLCNEFPIEPVMKKSKRNTSYVAGWEIKERIAQTLDELEVGKTYELKEIEKDKYGFPKYKVILPPPFKETKQQPFL